MNKSLRLFTVAAALAAAAALFYTCAHQIQKQRFIDARFTTAHMRTVQSETGLPLDLNELIGRPVPAVSYTHLPRKWTPFFSTISAVF